MTQYQKIVKRSRGKTRWINTSPSRFETHEYNVLKQTCKHVELH